MPSSQKTRRNQKDSHPHSETSTAQTDKQLKKLPWTHHHHPKMIAQQNPNKPPRATSQAQLMNKEQTSPLATKSRDGNPFQPSYQFDNKSGHHPTSSAVSSSSLSSKPSVKATFKNIKATESSSSLYPKLDPTPAQQYLYGDNYNPTQDIYYNRSYSHVPHNNIQIQQQQQPQVQSQHHHHYYHHYHQPIVVGSQTQTHSLPPPNNRPIGHQSAAASGAQSMKGFHRVKREYEVNLMQSNLGMNTPRAPSSYRQPPSLEPKRKASDQEQMLLNRFFPTK